MLTRAAQITQWVLRIGRLRTRPPQLSQAGTAGEIDFYGPAIVGASTIGAYAMDPTVVDAVLENVAQIDDDAYMSYVQRFVGEGKKRAQGHWRYADITTVLFAAAELLRPSSYLEIGVRRGRSMAVVARSAPSCSLLGIDWWNADYAGIANPGEAHVKEVIGRTGHHGSLSLLSGDSHVVLPDLFRNRPDLVFDLITVDGDHSKRGARADLRTVLPRLTIGGAIVFDDISHPAHPYLREVWDQAVAADRRYSTWVFDDVGYGVAVAIRRW